MELSQCGQSRFTSPYFWNFCSVENCIRLFIYIEQQAHRQYIPRRLDLYMSKLFQEAINPGVSLLIKKEVQPGVDSRRMGRDFGLAIMRIVPP